jgi:CheY-like chemotaxis protein
VRPKRILLVEDDPWVRDACVDLLRSLGHTLIAVDDGALALQEIPRLRPDVILLDLIMPKAELDGIGLLSQLAAGPSSGIPVVIISALGEAAAQGLSPEVMAALPIAAILSKPLSIETLSQEIDRLEPPGSTQR